MVLINSFSAGTLIKTIRLPFLLTLITKLGSVDLVCGTRSHRKPGICHSSSARERARVSGTDGTELA